MIVKVYSVFDSKLASFGKPWYQLADAAAIREFSDSVNDSNPKNPWFNHPEDYSLFYLGEFDDAIGKLLPVKAPLNLVTASALFKPVALNGKQVDFVGLGA